MSKKAIGRAALGFPLGISIGYIITILISMAAADGRYYPCVPALVDEFGNELAALIFQTALCGILGSAFGAASVIWEVEKWGIAKQTGLYFLVASLAMLPIAYFTHWMEHSLAGFLSYFSIFMGIFIAVWSAQYAVYKMKIRRLNEGIGNKG